MSVDDDLTLDDDEIDLSGRRKSLSHEVKSIAFFGPRQVSIPLLPLFECIYLGLTVKFYKVS